MPYSTDIKDYYRRAWGLEDRPKFKFGGSWADWETNFSDQMTFEEYLRMDIKEKKPHALDRKAHGGRIGYNLGSVVKYGITPAVINTLAAFGITAASVAKMAQENPTAINKIIAYVGSIPGKLEESDAQTKSAFKEWVSQFGTAPGDLPKQEEELKELLKPVPFPDQTDWAGSYKDEGFTIPEKEKIKVPDSIPPQIKVETEGFPIPEQKTWKDYVLYKKDRRLGPKIKQIPKEIQKIPLSKEVDVLDQKQLKQWIKNKVKEAGAYDDAELYKAYTKYVKVYGKGSFKVIEKDFPFSHSTIVGNARRRGAPITVGKHSKYLKSKHTLVELADKLQKNPNLLDTMLEDVNLNEYYTIPEILNILTGGGSKGDASNLRNLLIVKETVGGSPEGYITNEPVRSKKLTGAREILHLGDIIKNLKQRAKTKSIEGEGEFVEQTAERTRVENLLDKQLYRFIDNVQGVINNKARTDDSLKEVIYGTGKKGDESPRLTTDLGHLIPIEWLKKNSKVKFAEPIKDQLYGLNDLVNQHLIVNQKILRKQQGEMTTLGMNIDKFLKKYKGKKWNAESIKEAEKINGTLDKILDKYTKQIKTLSKGDLKFGNTTIKHDPTVAGQEGTLAGPKLNIRLGSEIKITDVIIDKSRINPKFILGKIDLINSKAVKMSDLSKAEKDFYQQAMIDQKMEHLFPLLREAGFTLDDIKTFEEKLLYGFLGEEGEVREFRKIKKATGGPALSGVDQYILNRYK